MGSELSSELNSELSSEVNSELNSELSSEFNSELRSELNLELISELSSADRAAHVKYYSQKLFNEYPDPIVSFKDWRGHFRE